MSLRLSLSRQRKIIVVQNSPFVAPGGGSHIVAEERGAGRKSEVMRRRNDLGDDHTLRFPPAHTQQDTHTHKPENHIAWFKISSLLSWSYLKPSG